MKTCGLTLMMLALGACSTEQVVKTCAANSPCYTQVGGEFEAQHKAQFTAAMQTTLAGLFAQKAQGLEDPQKIKAMEVLAMTDAAKSYALTQIYAVSAKHCGSSVNTALANFQKSASNIIALGAYYYSHGIAAKIGDQDLSKTGEELTNGLNGMIDQLEQDHLKANQQQLAFKCRSAIQALNSLAINYAN